MILEPDRKRPWIRGYDWYRRIEIIGGQWSNSSPVKRSRTPLIYPLIYDFSLEPILRFHEPSVPQFVGIWGFKHADGRRGVR